VEIIENKGNKITNTLPDKLNI